MAEYSLDKGSLRRARLLFPGRSAGGQTLWLVVLFALRDAVAEWHMKPRSYPLKEAGLN
ncbi:hypothetical protein [Microvirga sesbaniae]|uniref:hypothetical protein n=1 Tax=Microvirga sesbaniae TaxID=681392 RepID=UPI0021C692F9|nr:hypothetical protein [Microvirga sp. HBU67692]